MYVLSSIWDEKAAIILSYVNTDMCYNYENIGEQW